MAHPERKILPVTRTKDQAQASYDRMSRWYDLLSGPAEYRYRQTGLEMLAVQPGEAVLEIGCGTGTCLPNLIHAAAPAWVTAIDLSGGMLSQARSRLAKLGLERKASLTCGDAADLPFAANTFDVIFISFTLELFDTPEIPIVLAESRRVLASDGRLGVVAMNFTHPPNLMVKLYEWTHRHFEIYADCRPIPLREFLEGAGFTIQQERRMSMFGLQVAIVVSLIPS